MLPVRSAGLRDMGFSRHTRLKPQHNSHVTVYVAPSIEIGTPFTYICRPRNDADFMMISPNVLNNILVKRDIERIF